MQRVYVVTGAASGIGAATAQYLHKSGGRVIACDLNNADVVANLATVQGREALIEGVSRLSGGRVDAVIANAGGGPPETSLSLNFYGTVATLEGLRPLLERSTSPRAVAVSSIASLRPDSCGLVEACLQMNEPEAIAAAWKAFEEGKLGTLDGDPDSNVGLALYGAAKQALQRWCRSVAAGPDWAGAGIPLNVVALGFYDTPAAAYILADPNLRESMCRKFPLRGAYPGRAEDAAALLAWCVSTENAQMTGQVLFADAGFECSVRGGQHP